MQRTKGTTVHGESSNASRDGAGVGQSGNSNTRVPHHSSTEANLLNSSGDALDFMGIAGYQATDFPWDLELDPMDITNGGEQFAYPDPDELYTSKLPYYNGPPEQGTTGIDAVQGDAHVSFDPLIYSGFADFLQNDCIPERVHRWGNLPNGPSLNDFGHNVQQHEAIGNVSPDGMPSLIAPSDCFTTPSPNLKTPPPVPVSSKPNPKSSQGLHRFDPYKRPIVDTEEANASSSSDSDDYQFLHPSKKKTKGRPRKRNPPAFRPLPSISNSNARSKLIKNYNAFQIYTHLSSAPKTWSIFRYTSNGELEPGRLYSKAEIHTYLYRHPLHTNPNSGAYNPKHGSRLRLWIQRLPSDSARRYPSPLSARCRFKDCFATHNLINQGHLRVCFDQVSATMPPGEQVDPFHTASGYVHLNCLERHLDFPAICRDLPIQPENRILTLEPKGRNRMLLSPPSCSVVAQDFIQQCETRTLVGYPANARPHAGTLTWRLVQNKINDPKEAAVFRRQVLTRGQHAGSHICMHLGDLELEKWHRDLTRRPEHQVSRAERMQMQVREGWID
ncbi:MAG: hypothetical protein Q9220_000838 [cf. Caloplaca sp. 1 TL-2023]